MRKDPMVGRMSRRRVGAALVMGLVVALGTALTGACTPTVKDSDSASTTGTLQTVKMRELGAGRYATSVARPPTLPAP